MHAHRMLDEHFMDQMDELIRLCPRGRQTMLFSATMTDEVCSKLLHCVRGRAVITPTGSNCISFLSCTGERAGQIEPESTSKVVCGQ